MGKVGVIIALLYGLFHVLQLVLQAAAKRKEQERIRQEAERRRFATGQMSTPKTVIGPDDGTGTGDPLPRTVAAPAPQPIRAGRAEDDLAARRRAQLEELRTKREGRRAASPATGPVRSGPASPLPQPRSTAAVPRQVAVDDRARQRELDRQRMRQEEIRRRQQEQQAARLRGEAEAASRADDLARRLQQQQQRPQSRPEAAAHRPVAAASGTADASSARSAKPPLTATIADLLRSPGSMRQALILKEVLDRPMAMKDS